jgi:hypothetical protein
VVTPRTLNLLAELALGHQRISEAQLSNYVDGWVSTGTSARARAIASVAVKGPEPLVTQITALTTKRGVRASLAGSCRL